MHIWQQRLLLGLQIKALKHIACREAKLQCIAVPCRKILALVVSQVKPVPVNVGWSKDPWQAPSALARAACVQMALLLPVKTNRTEQNSAGLNRTIYSMDYIFDKIWMILHVRFKRCRVTVCSLLPLKWGQHFRTGHHYCGT